MKNLFKFGFLGLALTFAVAACNQPATTETEETTTDVIDEAAAAANDSIDSAAAAANDAIDSVENVVDSTAAAVNE